MKQKILSVPFILLLAITVMIVSCKKGDTGPAGAAGAQGPAGPNGNTGATGAAGTANVIYSPWLNVTFQPGSDTNVVAFIPAPKLVDSILNKGEIKVYFNAGSDAAGGQFVLPLPIYEPFLFTDTLSHPVTLVINSYFSLDTISIVSNFDVSSFNQNGSNFFQFRYILIPGGTTALPVSAKGTKKSINWNNYNEVKAYLGLKD
jgi:hypothetical protein